MDNTLLILLYEQLKGMDLYDGCPPVKTSTLFSSVAAVQDDAFDEDEGDYFCDLLFTLDKKTAAKKQTPPEETPETVLPYRDELNDFLANRIVPGFNRYLFQMIDAKKMTDSEVYTRANIDRRVVSKIRTLPAYRPSKRTVTAFALALRCTPIEAQKLVASAGYLLSDSEIFDVIIQFCIEHHIYDLIEVDEALLTFGQIPFLPENQERLIPDCKGAESEK